MAYVSSNYVTKAVALAQQNLAKVFPESFGRAGITVASAPGPHVLRLAVYIVDLTVAAPDVAQDIELDVLGRCRNGDLRDRGAGASQSGQLLGRAVDAQAAGDNGTYRRTYSSNVSDFGALFKTWAQISAKGFDELRALCARRFGRDAKEVIGPSLVRVSAAGNRCPPLQNGSGGGLGLIRLEPARS